MKGRIAIIAVFIAIISGCADKRPDTFYIGVNQTTQHPLLDEAYRGFTDRIGDTSLYKIIYRNAGGEFMIADQINSQLIDQKVDVLVALGTPSAQSAFKMIRDKKADIPLVFGVITDPFDAGLMSEDQSVVFNVTGTSDRWPYELQVDLISRLFPEARNIGILVNYGEDNCMAGMKYIRTRAAELGLKLIEKSIVSSADITLATSALVRESDVILISPSNTLFEGLSSMIRVANNSNIPVAGGTSSAVEEGSVITYSPNYYEVGRATAELVIRITEKNETPGKIPVSIPENSDLFINMSAAKRFGIVIPEDLIGKAKAIY